MENSIKIPEKKTIGDIPEMPICFRFPFLLKLGSYYNVVGHSREVVLKKVNYNTNICNVIDCITHKNLILEIKDLRLTKEDFNDLYNHSPDQEYYVITQDSSNQRFLSSIEEQKEYIDVTFVNDFDKAIIFPHFRIYLTLRKMNPKLSFITISNKGVVKTKISRIQ
jgi:hypothetical protein